MKFLLQCVFYDFSRPWVDILNVNGPLNVWLSDTDQL